MSEEFYIGWEAKAAPGISKTVRRAVIVVLALALVVPVVLALSQRMIGVSVFEWVVTRQVFTPPFNAKIIPAAVPRPGPGDHHRIATIREQMRLGRGIVRGP